MDYNFSEKTQMYARFNYWYEDQQGSAVSASNTSWGWLDTHYTAITPSGVISLTHIFTPTLVFQGTMGFSQFSEDGSAPQAVGSGRQRALHRRFHHPPALSERERLQPGSRRYLRRQ